MRFTIIKNKKDGTGETVQTIESAELVEVQKTDFNNGVVGKYREVFLALGDKDQWYGAKNMARVCPVSEYGRSKSGEKVWKQYNGVSVLEIRGTDNLLAQQKAKEQMAKMPQVLAAFTGADGHSVVVLTVATLPDGSLPETEEQSLLFATKAYVTSVQCLQPALEFPITIKAPTLDTTFLRTVDAEPYYNPTPLPYVFEQPQEADIRMIEKEGRRVSTLEQMKDGAQSFATYTKVFNSAFHRALGERMFRTSEDDDRLMVATAEECAEVGLPQEETVARLHDHFREKEIEDVRAMVMNVYDKCDKVGRYSAFTKHQVVAYKLREFLDRRYDIRFNEVMQMTEFRERQSLRFMYRELSRRELNTIHHEALIEGIEPTFGEVDELVHSSRVPIYNPIEDYLHNLPHWDGKDRITALAERVPTDDKNWVRLFRQWWLSMVAHWMNGDEKHANSTAPILIGAQGYRKSTFCRMLLPPELQMFYTDSIDFRTNIEAERSLSRFMLVNIDEFDQLTEKQFAFVKHLFQKPTTHIRRMYSETISSQRRYASFIGTTNSDEVLRDPTGNRRYLCVQVTGKIDTESSIDYSQLYSQAVHLINSGERYWINDDDEALIRETNKRFEVQDPLEQLFLTAFVSPSQIKEGEGEWLRSTEIMERLETLPAFNRKRDLNLPRLGKIMTRLNVAKRRANNGTLYLVKAIKN